VHPHELILDALSRRSPSEAGELVIRDLRDGSFRMLEELKAQTGALPTADQGANQGK